jgi:protein-S-isoprenylcysteine O-methyltransferase Ste14
MNSREESAPAKASPGLRKAGRIAYRYRQAMQLVLLAVALLLGRSLGSAGADRALLASALLLVVLGGALRSWAMGYHVWRRVYGPGNERSLVTAGPYAVTRNPLYLGTFMIGCGIAAMSGWAGLLAAFVVVFVPAHYSIIRWEEGKLVEEFPGEFPRYASEVPRLFPGLRWATQRTGRFDLRTMVRCMEPVKTLGFAAVIFLMQYLKTRGWTPAL